MDSNCANGRSRWLAAFAGLALLAGACSPAPAALATRTPPSLPTGTPTAVIGCSAIKSVPTPSGSSALPPANSSDYTRGPDGAPVTMIAYCDFQSAECELFNRVVDELVKNHPNDVKLVLRPLAVPKAVDATLDKSDLAERAALAAGNQGKFWEMRDLLHTRYADWAQLAPAAFTGWLTGQSASLGLDLTKFKADLTSQSTEERALALYEAAMGVGITGIPTVFVNGQLQQRPALSYPGLDSTISLIALGERQFKTCPAFAIDPARRYSATLHTDKGDLTIDLFADKAPLAVNSFVFLARQGWFDGVRFHRVIPGFVAQAGDPSGTGQGGPGYFFKNEIQADLTFDKAGVVGMANSGPDTNGSQFFITYAPQPQLDGIYTIFGQVVSGMDVVESLSPRDPASSTTLPPGDEILRVTIVEQ